jgi:uncharacterized membrane protein YidH (DUF202 family)
MLTPDKPESPFVNLLYAVFLILFGSIALLLAWMMWRSIDNWLFMTFALVSFAIPAFAAFFLGVRRLSLFVKFYTAGGE